MTSLNRIDLVRPDAPELAARGPFVIGVRYLELVNGGQIDVTNFHEGQSPPLYDRKLPLEIWYPADAPARAAGCSYRTLLRDGMTPVTLHGSALRDAVPLSAQGPFPLVILSHGYPGNRFLMSHLGENLASKGYVVASIEHSDSTYENKAVFASTLLHRPLDQVFVLQELDRLAGLADHFLAGLVGASRSAIIGYSMGGYGALIAAGGGVTEGAVRDKAAPPANLLAQHQAGSESLAALMDHRIRAVVPIAPWGRQRDIWDAQGLSEIKMPMLLIAGERDEVSGYEEGVRAIFEESTGCSRHLLTFRNAGHSVAAPIPAPQEAWEAEHSADLNPYSHYADPVWGTPRMNNIAQHFITAFLESHLKGDRLKERYLTPGNWVGFPKGTAEGLELTSRVGR